MMGIPRRYRRLVVFCAIIYMVLCTVLVTGGLTVSFLLWLIGKGLGF